MVGNKYKTIGYDRKNKSKLTTNFLFIFHMVPELVFWSDGSLTFIPSNFSSTQEVYVTTPWGKEM